MSGGMLVNGPAWGTAGNWSSGAIPVTNDLAGIPHTLNFNVTDASGDAKGVDLNMLVTHPGYAKSFGVSGTPIKTAADLVHVKGSGPFYFESHKDGASAFVTDEVRIEAATPNAIVEIGSDASDADSNIDIVNIIRGTVTLTGTIKFTTTGQVIFTPSSMGDATLTIVNSADTLPLLLQLNGRSQVDNIVTRLDLKGGECIKDTNKATEIDVFGGTLVYNHQASASDVTICRVHTGGVLDLTQNSLLKTFDHVIRYRGGVVKRILEMHTFTKYDELDEEG